MALTEPLELTCEVLWCNEAASVYEKGHHFGVKYQNLRVGN
jgi:hypothetical protein